MIESTTHTPAPHRFSVALSGGLPTALLCAAILVASSRTAQAGVNVWTNLGPPGGQVHALVIDPTRPGTLYVGTTYNDSTFGGAGGVFKSEDGGVTWSATGLSTSVLALAIDPTDPTLLYAGTNGAILRSTDGGSTWSTVYSGNRYEPVYTFAVDATGTLYAGTGTCGFPPSGSGVGGGGCCLCFGDVLTSTDGGNNWRSTGLINTGAVASLAIDATMPGTLYAATFDYLGYGHAGVFKSMDGGATWTDASTGLPDSATALALAIDPATPSTVYAGTYYNGVFKSTDGGATWTAASTGLPDGAGVVAFAIDPITPRTLYAATYYNGVFKSTDGATWTSMGLSGALFALTIDPALPGALYAAGAGVFRSTDSAGTWAATGFGNGGLKVGALAVDPITPGTLYVATDGYGAVFKSTDDGHTWSPASTGLPDRADVVAFAIDPTFPTTLYAGSRSGGLFKSTDSGDTWSATDLTDHVLTLAIDPASPTTLYAATVRYDEQSAAYPGVFKSSDAGSHWDSANAGLSDGFQVVALAIDPNMHTTVYAGAVGGEGDLFGYDGAIFKSTDAGATWATANNRLGRGPIKALVIDPTTPTTLYAATGYCDIGCSGPSLVKTTDGGTTWTSASTGLPENIDVVALAVDPTTPGTLYAGTYGFGVFKSTDGGGHWKPLRRGLSDYATIAVLALDLAAPNRLYAGTFGTGVFAIEQVCVCDCSGDGAVTIDELVTAVNIALDRTPLSGCQSLDADGNGSVRINELIIAVNEALNGCM